MAMTLEKWAEYGWLKAEPTSRDEIRNLLAIADRDLRDANVALISEDRRFEAAFSAARTSASIALRATGYRTSTQTGHHIRTIESLELTIKADAELIQRLKTLSKKRNATSYDAAGNVSAQELQLAITTATELRKTVFSWLQKNHPELAKE
jgi:hypothetical protein